MIDNMDSEDLNYKFILVILLVVIALVYTYFKQFKIEFIVNIGVTVLFIVLAFASVSLFIFHLIKNSQFSKNNGKINKPLLILLLFFCALFCFIATKEIDYYNIDFILLSESLMAFFQEVTNDK